MNLSSVVLAWNRNCFQQQTPSFPTSIFFFKLEITTLDTFRTQTFLTIKWSFQLTSPRPAFSPLSLTMFCRMPSKMGFSRQPWHLNTPCTGNSKKGFRLGKYPLTYSICHSICFKIPRSKYFLDLSLQQGNVWKGRVCLLWDKWTFISYRQNLISEVIYQSLLLLLDKIFVKEESVCFKIKTCICFKTFKYSAYTNYGRLLFLTCILCFPRQQVSWIPWVQKCLWSTHTHSFSFTQTKPFN